MSAAQMKRATVQPAPILVGGRLCQVIGEADGQLLCVPSYLTVPELAAMLRTKTRTIYSWVHKKRIPFRKAGRDLLFDPKEIDEWLKAARQ